jgi:demethylmenaquinone methyltransferase / 2-methoxy-6-polyprenyl-1,4-benzoquinol methylase
MATAEQTVDKSDARVREMFSQIAGRYDFLNHLLSLNIDRYWRWRTVRAVPPRQGARILDLCTGTGDLAIAYHKAASGTACIVGADFCYPMLARGYKKCQKSSAGKRISFIEADAQHIPANDNKFDIVCVAFGLRNVADTDRGLSEMKRVCARGGKVAVLELSTPGWEPFKSIYGWYFRNVLPRIGQLFARNSQAAYSYLPESVGQFLQGEQLADRMRAVGLVDVRYQSFTLGVATLYVGTKPLSDSMMAMSARN